MNIKTAILTVSVIAAIALPAYFSLSQMNSLEQRLKQRTAFKNQLDKMIIKKYNGTIIQSEIDGHCGITMYEIKVQDDKKKIHELYYNIDTGEQIVGKVTRNCDELLKLVNN